MRTQRWRYWLTITALACAGIATVTPARATTVTLATWNLEWLMEPKTFDSLAERCLGKGRRAGGSDRTIPCNIVPALRWSDADLARLAKFGRTLDADVIALQETDGAAAAARVFPGYRFCFTRRRHVQNVGFAIRAGIPFRCNEDYRPLGLAENDVRWGADLTLYPDDRRELRLLSVHLKSGCQRDPLTRRQDACRVLQAQVPVLERWIDARARQGQRFAVVGDFNRRFDREFAPARTAGGEVIAMWPEIDDAEPPESDLTWTGADIRWSGCTRNEQPRAPIDHIVLSRRLAQALVPGSFRKQPFPDDGARWPDHCPVLVQLHL